jgi:hypothetical protein
MGHALADLAPSPAIAHPAADVPVEGRRAAAPAWLISAVTHVAILSIFSLVVLLTSEAEQEYPPIPLAQIDPLPPIIVDPPPTVRPPIEPPFQIPIPLDPQPLAAVPTDLDVPIAEVNATDDGGDEDVVAGQDEVSDMAMDSDGFQMDTGAGPGAKGLFGPRHPIGKGPPGRTPPGHQPPWVEPVVIDALKWFKRHQSADGHWDVDGYQDNCADGAPKCEPGGEHTELGGDIACTAYALMCFNSAGYDQRVPSPYRKTVRAATAWLLAVQKADGLWGERNYEHAVATMAIAEAYAMAMDPRLRDAAQKGVDVILARQTREAGGGYGLGWDYVAPNPSRLDASVSGWNVMALKSAMAAGLRVGDGMEGARTWLTKAWQAANPGFAKLDPYKDASSFPYTWDSLTGKADIARPGADEHDMAPVGAVCAVFLGHKTGDPMLETLCNHIERYQQPAAWPMNTYYLYYNSMALFQASGERFARWSKAVPPLLLAAQRKDGCFAGSWDFTGTKFPGHRTGRLLSTAYCCLTLQVYWKYALVNAEPTHREAAAKPTP